MEAHDVRPGSVGEVAPAWIRGVRRAILSYYDARRRALPWRTSADPYRVWVSEVMLQQTRVETVIPYYERWIARFPDVDSLAAAPLDEVLHAWAGLGYYSRARNLHRAASAVRERHHGRMPTTAAALRTLPGVGEYTAGAVASIAFGAAVPAVDGNVRRVLSRLRDANLGAAELRALASRLVPRSRPGDFNQGLMELGATLCRPRAPLCARCPLHARCAAAAVGTQALRPFPLTRKPIPGFRYLTLVATTPGHVLLTRRTDGRLSGMWGFPAVESEGDVAPAARRLVRRLLGVCRTPGAVGSVSHAFSHRIEHYEVLRLQLGVELPPAVPAGYEWTPRPELHRRALSAAQLRIARLADV